MSDPGFASLGPTLLARKGGAKPAMRPQVAPLVQDEAELAALADEQLEDLGWNDMGSDDHDGGADVVPINSAVATDALATSASPIVRRQQRRLEKRVLADAVMGGSDDDEDEAFDEAESADYAVDYGAYADEDEDYEDEDGHEDAAEADYAPASPAPAPVAAPASVALRQKVRATTAPSGRRAAFTLRLDAERHLKLRLAATMQGVSAQALVTEALDSLLAEFDDLDVIAAHLKRH